MPRTPRTRPKLTGKARAAKKISIAQWDAFLARYPDAAPLDRLAQAAGVLGANVYVLQLLWRHKVEPVELVLLVLSEALLLTGIAHVQSLFVPREALMEKPTSLASKLSLGLFATVWLGGVYAIVVGAMLGQWRELLAALTAPWPTLRHAGLQWPLAITLAGALFDAVRDRMHWRSRGGYFLSTPGLTAGARWLTLFFGGIPFALPFFAFAFGLRALVKGLGSVFAAKAAAGTRLGGFRRYLPLLVPVLGLGVFFGGAQLVEAIQDTFVTGLELWALGYCLAKLASEAFITFLPWIAKAARTSEIGELAEAAAPTER